MSGNRIDKKTPLRAQRHFESADVLNAIIKLSLQHSVLLYRDNKEDHQFSLYVPEDKYEQTLQALRKQVHVEFRGVETHVWNGEDVERRFKIDLPDAFAKPILDGINRKIIPFAAARVVGQEQDLDTVLQETAETLAKQKGV